MEGLTLLNNCRLIGWKNQLEFANDCLTHPRTGFIFRRIKSLFHHSNWQHIFLISFNGTSKRGVMHNK